MCQTGLNWFVYFDWTEYHSFPYYPTDTHFTQFKPFHKYRDILGIFSNLRDNEWTLRYFKTSGIFKNIHSFIFRLGLCILRYFLEKTLISVQRTSGCPWIWKICMYLISQKKHQSSNFPRWTMLVTSPGSSSSYPTTATKFLDKWKKIGLKSVNFKTLTETREIESFFFRCLEKKIQRISEKTLTRSRVTLFCRTAYHTLQV